MLTLVANAGKARKTNWNGRHYFVAPVTAMVEGVLPGSEGPLFYPADQIEKQPAKWNNIPLVANHPRTKSGKYTSARTPQILEKQGIGSVYNSQARKGKLSLEAWFDVERTRKIAPTVHTALEKGEKIEVSTGLDLKAVPAGEGAEWNGKVYNYVTSDYQPDHLAVLTDSKGACSIEMGCGVFNADGSYTSEELVEHSPDEKPAENHLTANELSFDEVKQELAEQLAATYTQDMPRCYIMAVYDDYFVYEMGMDCWKQGYTRTDTDVAISTDQPVKVERVVTWEPSTSEDTVVSPNPTVSYNEDQMSKLSETQRKETVDFIVANCDCWKGEDSLKVLNGMPDTQLVKVKDGVTKVNEVVANAEKTKAVPHQFTDQAGFVHTWDQSAGKWTTTKPEPRKEEKPVANEATLTDEQKNLLAYAKEMMGRERSELVSTLIANVADDRKKAVQKRYESMDLDTLRDLAAALPEEDEEEQNSGQTTRQTTTVVHAPVTNRYVPPTGGKPTKRKEVPQPKVEVEHTFEWSSLRNGSK